MPVGRDEQYIDFVDAFLWIAIALFEVTAALWLLIKRVAVPQATR